MRDLRKTQDKIINETDVHYVEIGWDHRNLRTVSSPISDDKGSICSVWRSAELHLSPSVHDGAVLQQLASRLASEKFWLLLYMFSRGLWVVQIQSKLMLIGWNPAAPGLIQDHVQPLFPSQTARVKGVWHSSICRTSLSLWMRPQHVAELAQRGVFKLMRRVSGMAHSII